jgi:hypothetical protein
MKGMRIYINALKNRMREGSSEFLTIGREKYGKYSRIHSSKALTGIKLE